MPLVHDELRRIARRHMRHEPAGHTLQASALVNEAYLRLIEIKQVQWQNRVHFFAMAARIMRRILVDAARAKAYRKRGGGAQRVSLVEALLVEKPGQDFAALDDALKALGSDRPAEGPGRGDAVFRGIERRGDSRGPRRVSGHGDARLAAGEGLVGARAE